MPDMQASVSEGWIHTLREGLVQLGLHGPKAAASGLAVDERQLEQLVAYVRLLQQWGAAYNLSAVKDPHDMVKLHLLDCLSLVRPLAERLGGRDSRLLDVGAGAGLPGIVLAIALPQLQVLSVDAVAKKAAFMRQAGAQLGLKNFEARHARIESIADRDWPLITSRAFASLSDFVALTERLIAPGGLWMAMKGKTPQQEIDELPDGFEASIQPLQVPGLEAQRCLVWISKVNKSVAAS